jgi:hypothetical protein
MASIPTLALLSHVVHGQSQRTILEDSKDKYLGKVKVMTEILNKDAEIRRLALVCTEDSLQTDDPVAVKHVGKAAKIFKLRLPMTAEVGKLLFAAISIDESLPKLKRQGVVVMPIPETEILDPRNPAKNKITVSAQTYQNYKSGLKWWHRFDCPEMDKVGHIFPADTEEAINQAIASYKKDIGVKKRKGIMSHKEGKSKYNLFGYIEICKYFMQMKPYSHQYTWNEGMFARTRV